METLLLTLLPVLLILGLAVVGGIAEHRARDARGVLGARIDALSDAMAGRIAGETAGRLSMAHELRQVRVEVDALLERVALSEVDFSVERPLVQEEHSHVFGPQPDSEDAYGRTFRCQYPRCARISTVMR